MPAPYTLTLFDGANAFRFGDSEYSAHSVFQTDNACEMKDFIAAFAAANPNSGIHEEKEGIIEELNRECASKTIDIIPQESPDKTAVEEDSNMNSEDSAGRQGAPEPEVNSTIEHTTDLTEAEALPQEEEPTRPAEGEPHTTHNGETPQVQTDAGDPVDIFSGTFFMEETDLEIPNTIFPFIFKRFYRSGAPSFGPLGWNWDHNFNLFLRELNTGDMALWRNLHEEQFLYDGQTYEPPRGVFEKLVKVPAIDQVYEIHAEGGLVMHFERPTGWTDAERIPILWLSDRHGNTVQFSYDTSGRLHEIRDDDNHFFRLAYNDCSLLTTVSDHTGRTFHYQYDEENKHLVCTISPGVNDFPDGITRKYHYEKPWSHPRLRHSILRIEDAEGNVYLENKYEQNPASRSFGRVTQQLYGSYLYQFCYTPLQWVPANPLYINIPAMRVEVVNPCLGLEVYTFNYRGDLLDRRYRLTADKSFRVAAWQYEFDKQGNLSKTIYPDGSSEINSFNPANPDPRMRGKLLRKELTAATGFPSPGRVIWQGKYESRFQLITEEKNETGAVTTYKYDFDLNPASTTNTGKLLHIIHPSVTLPDGIIQNSQTDCEYNSRGQLTAVILPDGTRNENIYGISGNEAGRFLRQLFDSEGEAVEESFKYNMYGYISEKTDRNGNTERYDTNALGLPEKMILPEANGNTAEYLMHYNSDKKIISTERPKGSFTDELMTDEFIKDEIKRDVLGYPVEHHQSSNTAEHRLITISNHYRGFPLEITNPDGSRVKNHFDERGLLLTQTFISADENRISLKKIYDRNGRNIQETDEFGLTTKYEYDGFSRIVKVIQPNGTEIRNQWLPGDLLKSEEVVGDDGSGTIRRLALIEYTYDEKGRLITESKRSFSNNPDDFSDITTTFHYDRMDRLIKIINNRGGTANKAYNGLGQLVLETDYMGNEEKYYYDRNGNLIKTESLHTEPDGSIAIFTKSFEYDSRNRRTAVIEPDGARAESIYDDRNLLIQVTDYQGIRKKMYYDSFSNKIKETEDAGGLNITQEWIYDSMHRPVSFKDPTGQISEYEYDAGGRNVKTTYPNGFSSTRAFNEKNLVIKEVTGSGAEFIYKYDDANRITGITNTVTPSHLIPVEDIEYSYDGLNRVLKAVSGNNVIERRYDSLGRLLKETTLAQTIHCKYNDTSGEVEKIWPDGRTERLSHNLNGVLSRIVETQAGSLGSGNFDAEIKPSGPGSFGETEINNTLSLKHTYDERKRLTSIEAQGGQGLKESVLYCYNTANQKQAEVLKGQNPKLKYFEYDAKYRLKTVAELSSIVSRPFSQAEHDIELEKLKTLSAGAAYREIFEYNAADARLLHTESLAPDKNYSYQSGHRVSESGTDSYTHSVDGVLQSDGNYIYEADALGRIVKIISNDTVLTELSYDAFGRPSTIKEYGKPEISYNYLGGFAEQENENGRPVKQITLYPATGIPMAYHTHNGTHHPLFDARFNLLALISEHGEVIENYRYKSFGIPQIYNQNMEPIDESAFEVNPIFGGQHYLSLCGLYLSKKRLMNPENGLFLSPDLKGYADSPSLYVYAAQDPVNNIDPNGEIIPLIIAGFAIAGALAGAGYSVYDAYHRPERYEGWKGSFRVFGNVFGGALIGATAIVAGEAVLATGGAGIFAAGTSSAGAVTASSLTAAQTFALYGTSNAVGFGILRGGFNTLFPEYVDPVSAQSVAFDFVAGGGIAAAFRGISALSGLGSARGSSWTLQGDRDLILRSKRIWGQTEGSVYAMNTPKVPTWRATGGGKIGENSAIFEFQGMNNIFKPHEVTGPFSLLKRVLGQRKAGFGDISFKGAELIETRLIGNYQIPVYRLTDVELLAGDFAGQTASSAARRLWGRRGLDLFLGAGMLGAAGLTAGSLFQSETPNHPNETSPGKK